MATKISIKTANLGYPRIGIQRELKRATEAYWKGHETQEHLLSEAEALRKRHWQTQRDSGIDIIPSNDFSFYDQVLDTAALVGAVPKRYNWSGNSVNLDTYFAMARGIQERQGLENSSVPAMEMTKWFDTNYHYIVPEFTNDQEFKKSTDKPINEFKEALSHGIATRPVLVGPVTFLLLGKCKGKPFPVLNLLDKLLPVYTTVIKELAQAGAKCLQMDEPVLVKRLTKDERAALTKAYATFAKEIPGIDIVLTTYFGGLGDNLDFALGLPTKGIHVDLVRGQAEAGALLRSLPGHKVLSLGVIDGRNIWKSDLRHILNMIDPIVKSEKAEALLLAPSSSLLHTPLDLELEADLDEELKSWLSFSKQKLDELRILSQVLNGSGGSSVKDLRDNERAVESRRQSKRIHREDVLNRLKGIKPQDANRLSPFSKRQPLQKKRLKLPLYPTTTIGSFPQTPEVRQARARHRKGDLSKDAYIQFLKKETENTIAKQLEIGLDVLVHGEFERNDMVEYFGEQLEGFAFTSRAWVQSYGSRYVKPPIIFGDVYRSRAMTVDWFLYAQSLTDRPVKGMLTGPITILQWSFVRDDQPRSRTAKQIALAIRDEVADLEKAGAKVIQIDEPAIREGLPLRSEEWSAYLKWAVECFKLASCVVKDETQIHTHMCYCEFQDIMDSIAALDADVISIETSRSQMELLESFSRFKYPNEIGPGVYDIHSPRVPSREEIEKLLKKAGEVIPARNLWVNPDCGLKTRAWKETTLALQTMVQTARHLRELEHSHCR